MDVGKRFRSLRRTDRSHKTKAEKKNENDLPIETTKHNSHGESDKPSPAGSSIVATGSPHVSGPASFEKDRKV